MRAFLDTNVCVYCYDVSEPAKRSTALDLVRSGNDPKLLSTQVLQEFFSVVSRRLPARLSHTEAEGATRAWSRLPVVASDAALVQRAIRTVSEHQLSIWDALIVEAAVRGRCDVLYTEDLSAGGSIRGVEIVNPFA